VQSARHHELLSVSVVLHRRVSTRARDGPFANRFWGTFLFSKVPPRTSILLLSDPLALFGGVLFFQSGSPTRCAPSVTSFGLLPTNPPDSRTCSRTRIVFFLVFLLVFAWADCSFFRASLFPKVSLFSPHSDCVRLSQDYADFGTSSRFTCLFRKVPVPFCWIFFIQLGRLFSRRCSCLGSPPGRSRSCSLYLSPGTRRRTRAQRCRFFSSRHGSLVAFGRFARDLPRGAICLSFFP